MFRNAHKYLFSEKNYIVADRVIVGAGIGFGYDVIQNFRAFLDGYRSPGLGDRMPLSGTFIGGLSGLYPVFTITAGGVVCLSKKGDIGYQIRGIYFLYLFISIYINLC